MDALAATVSLVIPGRDTEATLAACLGAVTPLLERGELSEIVFVDDGSTDGSAEVARRFPVTVLEGGGNGPAAARNLGWRRACGELIWFLDADCVARPDCLARLRRRLDDPGIAGVGGSYDNMVPGSRLARLIHMEIRERHLSASGEIDYLGSFNLVYRRAALEEVGGFDGRMRMAEDADLSYRLVERGHQLRLEPKARAGHFHPTRLLPYLKTQGKHGYWATRLYFGRTRRARRNSYAGWLDHLPPPLALAMLATLPAPVVPGLGWLPAAVAAALVACHLPMTARLLRRTGEAGSLWWLPLATVRAFPRGVGMAVAVVSRLLTPGALRDRGGGVRG